MPRVFFPVDPGDLIWLKRKLSEMVSSGTTNGSTGKAIRLLNLVRDVIECYMDSEKEKLHYSLVIKDIEVGEGDV